MRNNIKKAIPLLVLITLLVLPLTAGAQTAVQKLQGIIVKIANGLRSVLVGIGIIFVIASGFYFITARGDEGKLGTARAMLLWALVGIGIGIIAPILVNFVVEVTGGLNPIELK